MTNLDELITSFARNNQDFRLEADEVTIDDINNKVSAFNKNGEYSLSVERLKIKGEEVLVATFSRSKSWSYHNDTNNEIIERSESESYKMPWELVSPRLSGEQQTNGPVPYVSSHSRYMFNSNWEESIRDPSANFSSSSHGTGWTDPRIPLDRPMRIDDLMRRASPPQAASPTPATWSKSAQGYGRPGNTFPALQRKIDADQPPYTLMLEWMASQTAKCKA